MTDLALLQAVRLKGGMADAIALSAVTGLDPGAVVPLVEAGLVDERRGRYRVTPSGREALDTGLGQERASLDASAVHEVHEAFVPFNAEFKELVHSWQLRGDEPNDHEDPAYDRAVLDRLDALHERFVPVVSAAVAAAPRLAPYSGRFDRALELLRSGDTRYFLSPVLDSYHQVWFELHEELIGLAGLTRLAEAVAGRAE